MPRKNSKYDSMATKYGFKYTHISDAGNIVCKKISAKSLKALKADGFRVYKMPNGSTVIKMK